MPVGYHGTLEHIAEKIVQEQRFILSEHDDEWLGHGVYFFKYRQHAVEWAKKEVGDAKPRITTPAVVLADLFFSEADLLDLDDPIQLDEVNQFMKEYLDRTPGLQINWNKASAQQRWCMVCNLYRSVYSEIKATCYTFHFKQIKPTYYNKNQFQYCITDTSVIKNIRKEALGS